MLLVLLIPHNNKYQDDVTSSKWEFTMKMVKMDGEVRVQDEDVEARWWEIE